jgi:hypothetical protein
MPHAGLMDEQALGPERGPFQRARLHIRAGRRRLRQGKTAAGIVTLYDALDAALLWYFASSERRKALLIAPSDDLNDDRTMFRILVAAGVLDGSFDFGAFDRLTERALQEELPGYDHREVLAGIEGVMAQLGVMPFDEAALPSEDPSTF